MTNKKHYLFFIGALGMALSSCHSDTKTNDDAGKMQVAIPTSTIDSSRENKNLTTQIKPSDTVGLAQFKVEKQKKYEDSLKQVGVREERERLSQKATNSSASSSSKSSAERNNTEKYSSNRTTKKKKGMSNGTKGALIGGGAGALTGALVTKHNRGVGALIGAAAGGGAGYLIGHSKDKKKKNNED